MAKRSSGFVLALMGLLAATGACSEPTSPAARAVRVDPSWVVGEAAAAVDPASGLFVLLPAATSVISVAAAEAAAVAYARYVLNPATTLELSARLATDRGGAISTWNRLSACARTVRAESPWRTALWRSADRQVHRNFRSALRTRAPVRVSTVRTTASRTSIR